MKIEFFTPLPDQCRGGIDLALKGLNRALGHEHEIHTRTKGAPNKDTQLVHFHGLWNPKHIAAYRHCARHQLPYLVSPHGMLEPWAFQNRRWKKYLWMKLLGQRQLDRAAFVLATSQMEADNLQAFTSKVEIAPLGLDEQVSLTREEARSELKLKPSDRIVLYLSRIDRKKGLDLLAQAIRKHPDCELWIVGDGDSEFTNEVKQINSENIRWIGPAWGSERWKYLLAADLFCLPTHSENFGFAILESLWVGTRTLTTTKTPWMEYADVDGLHICEDNLDSLRSALGALLPELDRPQDLSEWAHSKFHWDTLAECYNELYQTAVNQ